MEITRHFTATVFVVCEDKVLLHHHKKLGLLLPLGGHIERDELPEDAALREVMEESGLEVTLWDTPSLTASAEMTDTRLLHQPVALLLEPINPFHQHIDFIYFATTDAPDLDQRLREENRLEWYREQDLVTVTMPDNVRVMARKALGLLANKRTVER